jgi:hypothetical protein
MESQSVGLSSENSGFIMERGSSVQAVHVFAHLMACVLGKPAIYIPSG